MNLEQAYRELWEKIPEASRIAITVDLSWNSRTRSNPEVEYTVCVWEDGQHYQNSCNPSLGNAVSQVLAEIYPPKPATADLPALQCQLDQLTR